MKYLIWLLRIVLGGVFIFSGVVKANDPLGLTYKMDEFFEVWGWHGMLHYSFAFSILMIATEIICGFAMIVGNIFRFFIVLMLLLNVFFTFLTWYAWSSGKIHECGCFGDCFKLENDVTFYKDLALTAITVFLYIFRYRVFPLFNKAAINAGIMMAAGIFAFGFQYYTLHHLPVHDCLPFKVGNNIYEKSNEKGTMSETSTKMVSIKKGIRKEITMDEYTNNDKYWDDTTWHQETKMLKEGKIPEIQKNFINGDDAITEQILSAKGYTFLWFIRNPKTAHLDNRDRLRNLIDKSASMHLNFYVLSTIGTADVKDYQDAWNMKDVKFYSLDEKISKTAMRTDPGLILLHDGVVEQKWSYLDYPKEIVLENGKLICK